MFALFLSQTINQLSTDKKLFDSDAIQDWLTSPLKNNEYNEGLCKSDVGFVLIVTPFSQFTKFVTPINQTIENINNNDNHNKQVFFNMCFIIRNT